MDAKVGRPSPSPQEIGQTIDQAEPKTFRASMNDNTWRLVDNQKPTLVPQNALGAKGAQGPLFRAEHHQESKILDSTRVLLLDRTAHDDRSVGPARNSAPHENHILLGDDSDDLLVQDARDLVA